MNITLEHHLIKINGVTLHVVQAGPMDGPLVLLLHGFPEYWGSWRKQISFLSRSGFRVWAPDQRGYNLSDKPRAVTEYNVDALADDIVGLIDASGRQKIHLAGHDWGGAVAWWVARLFPERLERLVILNAPHGAVMQQYLRKNRQQQLRSWYMTFFQIPWLPETLIRLRNWRLGVAFIRRSGRPGIFCEEELLAYRKAWSQPGSMHSMINWYRALSRFCPVRLAAKRIAVPTLILWGVDDVFLGRDMAQASLDYCDSGRLELFENTGHWIQHEQAERVNRLMTEFFDSPAG